MTSAFVYNIHQPLHDNVPDVIASQQLAIDSRNGRVVFLLLGVNLITDVLLGRFRAGAGWGHIVWRSKIDIEGIVEETVVQSGIRQYVILGFTIITEKLGVELTTVLVGQPVKIAKVDISKSAAEAC